MFNTGFKNYYTFSNTVNVRSINLLDSRFNNGYAFTDTVYIRSINLFDSRLKNYNTFSNTIDVRNRGYEGRSLFVLLNYPLGDTSKGGLCRDEYTLDTN